MNDALLKKALEMSSAHPQPAVIAKNMLLTKNMDMLFHHFGGLDAGTLRYFSVTGLPLSDSDYRIILFFTPPPAIVFSDVDDITLEQAYLHTIIQEEVELGLTGQVSFWSTELDGKVAVLVNFANKVPGTISKRLDQMIQSLCEGICSRCKSSYDIDVYALYSPLLHGYRQLAWTYYCLEQKVLCYQFLGITPQHIVQVSEPENMGPTSALEEKADPLASHIAASLSQEKRPASTLLPDFAQSFAQSIGGLTMSLAYLNRKMNLHLMHLGILHSSELQKPVFCWVHPQASSFAALQITFEEYCDRIIRMVETRTQSAAYQRVSAVKRLIQEQYRDSTLSISGIAEALGVSVSTLTKQFRSVTGLTLWDYLQSYRMEQACRLLISTDDTLTTIGMDCGFGSTETMHRLFRLHYHKTPNQIRKESRSSSLISPPPSQ